jgi:glycosyltransferase involved in cell wall biosynthesis
LGGGPRRVALIIGQLTEGGAERQLYELATRLPGHDIEPVIFCLSEAASPYGERLEALGLTVHRLPRTRRFELRRVWDLARRLRASSVDLVHSYLFVANGYGHAACLLARQRLFLPSVRSLETDRPGILRMVDRMVLGRARLVLVNSPVYHRLLPERLGVDVAKLRLVPNGLDLARFSSVPPPAGAAARTRVVGSISLFKKEKRIPFLLETARLVREQRPDVRFRLVGDGPERQAALDVRKRLALEETVELPGASQDIPGELARFDIFILASEREGMPNAILEAMAAGRPVVASRVVGITEVVQDGDTGLLFDPDDPRAAAGALLRLLADDGLARRLGERGRQVAQQQYSVEMMVERTVAVYRELMAMAA